MKPLQIFSAWLAKWTPAVVAAAAVVSFFVPAAFGWVRGNVQTSLLGLIMLTMGLTLTGEDFKILASRPLDIAIGTVAQFTLMPLIAYVLVHVMGLPKAVGVGLILVGCCPGGVSSNIMSFLCKGDVAFSVGMTTLSTLMAPVMTPLLMLWLAGESVDVDAVGMFTSILFVTILPVAIGFGVNAVFGERCGFLEVKKLLPGIAVLGLACIVGGVVSAHGQKFAQSGIMTFVAVFFHNTLGYVLGYASGVIARFNDSKRRTISIEVGMQNAGLATVLAGKHFPAMPEAAIASAVSCVWHSISGALLAGIFNFLQRKTVSGRCACWIVAALATSVAWRTCGDEIVCQFTGAEGRKATTLMEERVFGAAAKGPIYEETVKAFRTHQDDSGIWQGEYWGKTMLSAAVVAEWTGNEAHKAWLRDQARVFVKEFQQPDGYLCTYSDRRFVGGPKPDAEKRKGWDREVFCWNLWGRKYTMWALIEIARVADAPDLLAAAARMMDQEIRQLKESGVRIENTGFFVGLPSMSVLKPLMVLWRATKNEEYLKFAQEIVAAWDRAGNPMPNLVANAFSDKPVHEWYPNPWWWAKAYEMMSCMEGLVDFACDRKDARVLDAVRRLAAKIAKDEMNAVGGVGYFDHFTHAAACVNATTEPCDVVHWMRVNRALFLATDAPSYLDDLETAFFNAFLAGVYHDGKWGAHSVRSHGTRHRTAPHQVGMKFHQCCIDNMPRGFVDVAHTVVTRAPDGAVSLNLCLDAEACFPEGSISISGGYPYADRACVRVTATRKFRLRIRVPAAPDSLLVDGRAAEGRWFFADVVPGERMFDLQFRRSPRIVGNPSARAEDRREGQFEEVKENPEMKGRARQKVGARIIYGPLILAKGRYAGTGDEEIFRDRVADGEWKATIRSVPPRKTSGAWLLKLSRGTEQVEIPVSDFASVADADDTDNRFSIWF